MAKGFGLCMASGSVTSMSDECFHSACLSIGGFPLVVQSCTHDSLSFTRSLSHSIPLSLPLHLRGLFFVLPVEKRVKGGGLSRVIWLTVKVQNISLQAGGYMHFSGLQWCFQPPRILLQSMMMSESWELFKKKKTSRCSTVMGIGGENVLNCHETCNL